MDNIVEPNQVEIAVIVAPTGGGNHIDLHFDQEVFFGSNLMNDCDRYRTG